MCPADNKTIIRTYVETIWNQQQMDRADELVAPDIVDHGALPGRRPGWREQCRPKAEV